MPPMSPRQPFPFGGGMPPQMRMMNSNMGMPMGRPGMGPMGRPPMGQMGRPMGQMAGRGGPLMRQGGGLLSKLLGRGNPAQRGMSALGSAGRAAGPGAGGGSLLKSLSNPSAISGFLSNTQKVLSTAQQVGPMIQQYGPVVKNLPAMWRLYKGFKSISNEAEAAPEESAEQMTNKKKRVASTNRKDQQEKEATNNVAQAEEGKEVSVKSTGTSVPKLYI